MLADIRQTQYLFSVTGENAAMSVKYLYLIGNATDIIIMKDEIDADWR